MHCAVYSKYVLFYVSHLRCIMSTSFLFVPVDHDDEDEEDEEEEDDDDDLQGLFGNDNSM